MKGFPKKIGSGQDLFHCLNLVQAGELPAEDLRRTVAMLENRRFLHCPVLEMGKTRKTVTIAYCPEAATGGDFTKVEHIHNADRSGGGMEGDAPTDTVITLAAALPEGETVLLVPAPVDPFAALGITPDQLDAIKEVLNQYE